jgi:hypothetical protein
MVLDRNEAREVKRADSARFATFHPIVFAAQRLLGLTADPTL